MKFLFTNLAVLFLSIISVLSQHVGSFSMQYDETGTTRVFSMYVPENYTSSNSYSPILAIHAGGMPSEFMRDWFIPNANNVSGILICPDENANWTGSVANNALEWAQENYNLNQDRNLLSGFGTGGVLALYLAWTNYESTDGVIVVNPSITEIPDSLENRIGEVPTAIIIGTADTNYLKVKKIAQNIGKAGGKVLLIEKEGVIHSDGNYLPSQEFYNDWLECYTYIFGEIVYDKVILKYPVNQQTNILTPSALAWEAAPDVNEYIVELAEDITFGKIIHQINTNDLYIVTDKLSKNSQYWWRVSALIDGERKYTSDVYSFSTFSDPNLTSHIYLPVELEHFDNRIRHFCVETPSNYSPNGNFNIILGLHGMGQTVENMSEVIKPYKDYINAVTVCPSGNGDRHDDEFMGKEIEIGIYAVQKVKDLLDFQLDNTYLVGFSYGGREAMYYGMENYAYFKGIIAISPAIQGLDDANNNLPIPWPNLYKFENTTKIPICILDGQSDHTFYPFISAFYSNLIDHGGHLMRYTFSDAGHDVISSYQFESKFRECLDFINMEGSLPGNFDLTQPDNNAADIMLDAELQWSAASGAGQYELVLSKNDDLSNPIQNNILDGNLIQLSDLEELTTYFWKIRAINTYGWTAWSETRSFTTGTKSSVLETENGTMMIYPVPANDYLNLDFSNQTFMDASIEIFNSIGQRVYLNKDVNNLKLQINLIDFKAGQYSIRINLNGEVYNKSFIKM